jgi:hypothetical protein
VLALQLLFIASYVGAPHHPKLRDVPFGVAAPRAAAEQAVARLEGLPGEPLDPRTVADRAAAREQILDREIAGTLLIDPADTTDALLVASGGGRTLANALDHSGHRAGAVRGSHGADGGRGPGRPRGRRRAHVLPPGRGLVRGRPSVRVGAGVSAGARPTNIRRGIIRLGALALFAIVGGLGGAVIAGPVLTALPGSVAALWGLGALVVFAVGAATLALQCVFGIAGIGVAVLLVVFAGNPSAGGALPPPLLPPFWAAIGPALPPGAGVWVARSIAYFESNDVTGPLLVLCAWAVAGAAITVVMAALKRKPAAGQLIGRSADRLTG